MASVVSPDAVGAFSRRVASVALSMRTIAPFVEAQTAFPSVVSAITPVESGTSITAVGLSTSIGGVLACVGVSAALDADAGGANEGRAEAGSASEGDEADGGGPLDAGPAPPDVQPATAMTVNATRSGRFIGEVLGTRQASRVPGLPGARRAALVDTRRGPAIGRHDDECDAGVLADGHRDREGRSVRGDAPGA